MCHAIAGCGKVTEYVNELKTASGSINFDGIGMDVLVRSV